MFFVCLFVCFVYDVFSFVVSVMSILVLFVGIMHTALADWVTYHLSPSHLSMQHVAKRNKNTPAENAGCVSMKSNPLKQMQGRVWVCKYV